MIVRDATDSKRSASAKNAQTAFWQFVRSQLLDMLQLGKKLLKLIAKLSTSNNGKSAAFQRKRVGRFVSSQSCTCSRKALALFRQLSTAAFVTKSPE